MTTLLAASGDGGGGNAQVSSIALVFTVVNYDSISPCVLQGMDSLTVLSSSSPALLTGVALSPTR